MLVIFTTFITLIVPTLRMFLTLELCLILLLFNTFYDSGLNFKFHFSSCLVRIQQNQIPHKVAQGQFGQPNRFEMFAMHVLQHRNHILKSIDNKDITEPRRYQMHSQSLQCGCARFGQSPHKVRNASVRAHSLQAFYLLPNTPFFS